MILHVLFLHWHHDLYHIKKAIICYLILSNYSHIKMLCCDLDEVRPYAQTVRPSFAFGHLVEKVHQVREELKGTAHNHKQLKVSHEAVLLIDALGKSLHAILYQTLWDQDTVYEVL